MTIVDSEPLGDIAKVTNVDYAFASKRIFSDWYIDPNVEKLFKFSVVLQSNAKEILGHLGDSLDLGIDSTSDSTAL